MYCQAVLLAVLSLGCNALGAALPDYIHVCRRSDPQVEQCILQSIEELRPRLKNGLPELDVPPFEPLFLPLVKVSDESSGFTAVGKNIKAYGATDFKMTKLKLDVASDSRLVVHIGMIIPRIEFEGEYETKARILSLPIVGHGTIRANATNADADMIVYAQVRKKGNHNYLRFNKMDMTLNIDDYSVHLSNLFGGDKALEEAANKLLNENRKEFMQSINPIITKTAIENILDVANKIAKNQPYDVLFPQ